jgi:hypothetical protein
LSFCFSVINKILTSGYCQTAILLDLVREEVSRESRRADNDCVEDDGLRGNGLPHWASHALELVELILRPPEGGPPCLPDHSEQVYFLLVILLHLK